MTIIWQTSTTTLADTPPETPYDGNNYEGTIWINIANSTQFFGSPTAGWIPLDPSSNMAVTRSGITLTSTSPAVASVALENIGGSLGVNGSQVAVLGSAGQITTTMITLTSPSPEVPSIALENINGKLNIGGNPVPTLGIGTVAQMLAISTPVPGQEFYTVDNNQQQLNKKFIYTGRTWQSPGSTIELQCGEALNPGAVVEISPNVSYTCRKCQATRDKDVVGTMFKQQALGDWATVCISGIWDVAVVFGTYASGTYLLVDSVDGFASAATSTTSGIFAQVLESKSIAFDGGTVKAFVFTVEHY